MKDVKTKNGRIKKYRKFIDWMEKFKLWDIPINSFCQKLENLTTEAKNLIKDLKETFPIVFFSGGLGRCNKMMAEFELKDDI